MAERRPHKIQSPHGEREDCYYWLRDDSRSDPKILAYLVAENNHKDAILAPLKALEDQIFNEIVGRMKNDDSSVPYHYRGHYYYSRYEKGREYAIHCRKRGSQEAREEVLLDVNQAAKGYSYYAASSPKPSPDNRWQVFAEDTVGRYQYALRFQELSTGKDLDERIENTTGEAIWAEDSKTVFYVEKDPKTLLGTKVRKHVLGTDPAGDPVVYEEKDCSFYLGIGKTSDERYIGIHSSSTVSDELRFIPADQPNSPFQIFAAREDNIEYSADHVKDHWVIRTNLDAENFRIMEVKDNKIGDRKGWSEVIPHDQGVYIAKMGLFDDHLVIAERRKGLKKLRIHRWSDGKEHFIAIDDPASVTDIDFNAEPNTPWLRFNYNSLKTPLSIYEEHMETGERRLLKRQEVPGDFDSTNYETERLWANSRDGKKIPVSLVRRKGVPRDGTAPMYQYGYGSYGSSIDPDFRSTIISLLDRGVVFAIAHIRGGQELGRPWYDDGKLLHKKNTFYDFIDVTEFLIAQKIADPGRVAAVGGSAGGLLVGAVANLRPDLYRVIAAHVPFVDVVTTMLDETIPLTTNEFDEWGDPKEQRYYDYMLSYSPYDEVEAKDYPAMLVTSGLWDSQVQYFEPTKWVARLRHLKTDERPLLLHTNMEAGHGGKSGRFLRQRERAMEYAFILDQLCVSE